MTEHRSRSRSQLEVRRILRSLRRTAAGPTRHLAILALDALIAAASLWLAYLLRFEGRIPASELAGLWIQVPVLMAARLTANLLLQLHRWSFRYSGLTDGARVAVAGLLGTGLLTLALFLLSQPLPPRSVVVLELLVTLLGMTTLRFFPRLAWTVRTDRLRARRDDTVRTLVLGAGDAGELLLRDLRRSSEHGIHVVGFVDDDATKWGTIVGGRLVLGGREHLPKLAEKHDIAQLLIAIPKLPPARVRDILAQCADLKLKFKILPASYGMLQQQGAAVIQDLRPEDLLAREPVLVSRREAEAWIAGRTALVTGAAGSIGSEICEQLLGCGLGTLVRLDMDENGLYLGHRDLERRFPEAKILTEVADIRDRARMRSLLARHRPQDVFHAAAHKHVPLMEQAPCEAVKNNVNGTRILAQAAREAEVRRFVLISTDKAVRPTSVMGVSKRVAEMIVRDLARTSETRFSAVRFGNVLDSAGSVVRLFREQIARGGPVTVTHPEVCRYFMTLEEAVALVLKAGYGDLGDLCVLEMGEQIPILDLAKHMITLSGKVPEVEVPIEIVGLRQGEKLREELLTEEEERTHRIHRKIHVAESRAVPQDFHQRLERLLERAAKEDAAGVLEELHHLVPTFQLSGGASRSLNRPLLGEVVDEAAGSEATVH